MDWVMMDERGLYSVKANRDELYKRNKQRPESPARNFVTKARRNMSKLANHGFTDTHASLFKTFNGPQQPCCWVS